MKWHRLAADQGRADAQYQFGHLYYKPRTITQKRRGGFRSRLTKGARCSIQSGRNVRRR
jgi:TPR repeat protein